MIQALAILKKSGLHRANSFKFFMNRKKNKLPYETKMKEQQKYFTQVSRRRIGQNIPKLLLCVHLIDEIIEKCLDESSGDWFYLVDFVNFWGRSWVERDLLMESKDGRELVEEYEKSLDGPMDIDTSDSE